MVFYRIDAIQVEESKAERQTSRDEAFDIVQEISEQSEALLNATDGDNYMFVSSIRRGKATLGAVVKNNYDINKLFTQYEKMLPIEFENSKVEEITFSSFSGLLSRAANNGYIEDDEKILDMLEVLDMHPRYNTINFGETMLNDGLTKSKIYNICEDLLLDETMAPELDRIYTPNTKTAQGHPVHYMIQIDNRGTRKTVYRALLSALYSNGRIQNKRYCYVDYDERSRAPGNDFEALYKSCTGGAMIIRYNDETSKKGEFANRGIEVIRTLCEIAMKYRNRVLTIICLPRSAEQTKQTFLSRCGDTSFVEIYEDVIYGERAATYLKNRAKEYNVRPDKNLTDFLKTDNKGYSAQNLNSIFDKWYDQKLRHTIYPQYKEAITAKAALQKEEPKGSAYDKLQQLIGLENAKKVMDGALNYFKAQKVFADRGVINERPAMHMIFTGNPGTAKTTVARLFAQIMKENGLLPKGDMLELGRADLVGQYVGWTAQCVKDAFKKAKGGVLFIDEAYSLVDDRKGSFGDEAINTIVQEMENHRADTVVIFAGYPNEMESFLNKNPGLSSRIAFHIPFDDYSSDELCKISALIAGEKGLKLDDGAMNKLGVLFENARKRNDFGNGRYARNIIEKAKMTQANRLMQMDLEKITDDDLFTLCAADIEELQIKNEVAKIKIGFSA